MKIAVLGCGPAGLLAAHAAALNGHEPVIYSRKVMSPMPGAMYVHEPIPEACPAEPESYINYLKLGTREGYARKVYGEPDAACSWDSFPQGHQPAWNMRAMYEELWERYADIIIDAYIDAAMLNNGLQSMHDKVFSTIPAPALCWGDHDFPSQDIWVRNEHRDACEQLGDPCVIYNGDPHFAYYRTSLIFGYGSTEFTHRVEGAVRGKKPLSTNCDCRPDLHRLGRFGKWTKGVLVHHAFREAMDALQ